MPEGCLQAFPGGAAPATGLLCPAILGASGPCCRQHKWRWVLPPSKSGASPLVCSSTSLRDGGHSPELPVEVGEQLVATGDGDRLSDKAGGSIGIPVAQTQGQEAAEVGVEPSRRAVTDATESTAQ